MRLLGQTGCIGRAAGRLRNAASGRVTLAPRLVRCAFLLVYQGFLRAGSLLAGAGKPVL